ncbi:MAG: tRNA (N6-threonylcarbamoyladenosine(37)-N6)-methyltransferase TrmO [Deltaproteobacteria bacterium]|jgi:tRNA (adenine37-N6)-methyltransferase|nr:tRNA (N6-threonylcarbamoyladenosine(37)-N6)-methyltransferase TrmO [Deltaproteobacteria bacterium]MBT4525875.1 tRNA (N6-threonylcarbamoyladenosine(37)-N6)-methyltransferase TrmO [Deltaproteobacteria bacterium]
MITFTPIGTVHSPHKDLKNMPIQPKGAKGIEGHVLINESFVEGLSDLDGFSHVYLIYHFHAATRVEMKVIPFMDKVERGIFSTRSTLRPNHIGLSIMELLEVEGNKVLLKGMDILDGTPVLDIKPYIANFDKVEKSQSGWMQASPEDVKNKRSDNRYV